MSNYIEISLSAARRAFLAGVPVALIHARSHATEIVQREDPLPGRRMRRNSVRFFRMRVRDAGAKAFLIER